MNDVEESIKVLIGDEGIHFCYQPDFPSYWQLFLWKARDKPNLTVPPTWDGVMALLS